MIVICRVKAYWTSDIKIPKFRSSFTTLLMTRLPACVQNTTSRINHHHHHAHLVQQNPWTVHSAWLRKISFFGRKHRGTLYRISHHHHHHPYKVNSVMMIRLKQNNDDQKGWMIIFIIIIISWTLWKLCKSLQPLRSQLRTLRHSHFLQS